MRREKQELYCHNCQCYVQFDIDLEQNGNHVIICPNCKHEHYRMVVNGIITDIRWNNPISNLYTATILGTTPTSTYGNYVVSSPSSSDCTFFTYNSWGNNGTTGYI